MVVSRFNASTVNRVFLCALTAVVGFWPQLARPQDREPASSSVVAPSIAPAVVDPLLTARYSLQLKNEPLEQMLGILGPANDLRFRFAVVPDATVSIALNDSLLLPALNDVLHAVGFDSVRQARQIWVTSRRPSRLSTTSSTPERRARGAASAGRKGAVLEASTALRSWPATWQIWTRPTPPGKGWMAPLALKTPVSTAQRRASDVRRTSPAAIPAEPPLSLSGWRTLSLDFAPDPFGVAVRADQSTLIAMWGAATPSPTRPTPSVAQTIWLRWPFWLRQLPRGAQLRLHTAGQATLWVNGARVLQRWSGPQLLEVDNLLQIGFNCVALELSPPSSLNVSATEPLLRYEWLFAKF